MLGFIFHLAIISVILFVGFSSLLLRVNVSVALTIIDVSSANSATSAVDGFRMSLVDCRGAARVLSLLVLSLLFFLC